MADSHSKWLEVLIVNSTTAGSTVTELRKLFAAYGQPESMVSDNGPQFTSEEFETFLKLNGAKHVLCPPYHPASNDLAERNVQTFKNMLEYPATSGFWYSVSIQKHTTQHHRPYSCWSVSGEGSPNKVNPAEAEPANQDSWQSYVNSYSWTLLFSH